MDQLDIKSKEGYGFLMFKSKMGPIRVFEAGDTHRIKGTKIECRKVLERDAMMQQVHEGYSNQTPRAQLVAKPSPIQHTHTPQSAKDWDRKSGWTSGMDTTIRTTEGGPNSTGTPFKRSLRNTGQVFKFPPEYEQNPDESFLTNQGHEQYHGQPGQYGVQVTSQISQDHSAFPPAHQAQIPKDPQQLEVKPPGDVKNSILSFLDEDDEPWPEENSRSRLTIVPRIPEEEDGDLDDK